MAQRLERYTLLLEDLAKSNGLDYYPVEFELVPPSFMMEISVYGLPVRMPHWSFGVRYIYQLVQHQMGHSRIFEVVYPGNPGRAYLANTNTIEENTLVVAHVLGHADFSKNNALFRRAQEEVGYHIVEQAAAHAKQITDAMEQYGHSRVENVLDAALALEQNIDVNQGLRRTPYPRERKKPQEQHEPGAFRSRFDALSPDQDHEKPPESSMTAPVPPHPEHDLLWFLANYAPDMEGWERDILLAVREESFYFYPVFACQIMNEGWASYWHARLLRDSDFLPSDLYVEAIKTHSDVVRPYAGKDQVALSINPYHLGFFMWEEIIRESGLDEARHIMEEEDDFGFIRNYLTHDMAERLGLFEYKSKANGEIRVESNDIDAIRETILAPKFNFGTPVVAVTELKNDGSLVLTHEYGIDKRGLDLEKSQRVLQYIQKIWRRPVVLHTVDRRGKDEVLVETGD